MCMDDHLTLTIEKAQQKQFQGKASEQCCSTHSISPDSWKNTVLSHTEFPPSMESMPSFPGKQFLQGREKFTLPDIENMLFFLGKQFLQRTLHPFRTIRREKKLPLTSKEICKRTQTGETNISSTQTKYILGTSYSRKPMYHKLLLDHAGEWYRTAKSVQEDQIYVKDQMHPDRSRADRIQEQPIDRIRESWISHPSYSQYG